MRVDYFVEAKAMEDEIIQNRRIIHGFAELGFDLPETTSFVKSALKSYGYETRGIGCSGISATVGQGSPVLLLRADMDALPMPEESGEDFAAKNGNCHACGHDCHTAMLLAAAKLLKSHENELKGTVKFMFQPAEERLSGAQDMIDNGLLTNPNVDAAMAFHVNVGREDTQTGKISYLRGCAAMSADEIHVTVHGKSSHSSQPEKGIDAIYIAAQLVIALQGIVAREISPTDHASVVVGQIEGGRMSNSVADYARLKMSVRSKKPEVRKQLLRRIHEICEGTASTFNGSVDIKAVLSVPPLMNDDAMLDDMLSYLREIYLQDQVFMCRSIAGSEDFTAVAAHVPAVMLNLCMGSIEEGYTIDLHHPKVRLNEKGLIVGAAAFAHCAVRWLEEHKK